MSAVIAPADGTSRQAADDVFYCLEESNFYSQCLKSMLFTREATPSTIVEFGSGDGGPVIDALCESRFAGLILGFELGGAACELANANIEAYGLQDHYCVYRESFFDAASRKADCLIANPPYLPAPDGNIRLPLLYGGADGSTVTNALLSLNYDSALLMISSYSNPVGTLRHAAAQGYAVSDFMIAPLAFGIYSSEPKVKRRIETLRAAGRAFYQGNMYLLAGVLFKQRGRGVADLAGGLTRVLTAL